MGTSLESSRAWLAFPGFQACPEIIWLQKGFTTAKVPAKGSHSLSYLLVFHIIWAGAGITYQQMFILSSLTSPPSCSNTMWGSLWLFNSSQIRTTALQKHQFAEVCDSAREITPQDSYCLIKWFWDYSGTVNFGCQAPDSWINSSVNKDRISSAIHSDPQLGSACELRFEFSSIL